MDYEKLLTHFKKRRDYFKSIDFQQNAGDLDNAITAIETLLKEVEEYKPKEFPEVVVVDNNKEEK